MCGMLSVFQLRSIHVVLCASLPLALLAAAAASADPARFWISESSATTPGPESPSIKRANGSVGILHIWAQPTTVGDGPYGPANLFKQLQNLSLNLVTDTNLIDFQDDKFTVYNPVVSASKPRFQFVFDSNTDPALKSKNDASTTADRIDGLQAFSVDSADYEGLGPACAGGEPFCIAGGAGGPAWLIATVGYKTLQPAGTVTVDLEIGLNGMNHAGEESIMTTVAFGTGAAVYNASLDRGSHSLGGDTPELTITACAKTAGDYNGNCIVDAADYTAWRDTLNQAVDNPGDGADGNNSGTVESGDYTVWKNNFGTVAGAASGSGSLGGPAVPEPSSLAMLWTLAGFWAFASRRASPA